VVKGIKEPVEKIPKIKVSSTAKKSLLEVPTAAQPIQKAAKEIGQGEMLKEKLPEAGIKTPVQPSEEIISDEKLVKQSQ